MFTRDEFLLATVKEWLKSVLHNRSYLKNKTGYPFLDHPVVCQFDLGPEK